MNQTPNLSPRSGRESIVVVGSAVGIDGEACGDTDFVESGDGAHADILCDAGIVDDSEEQRTILFNTLNQSLTK